LRLKYAKIAANIDAHITACHYTEDLKIRFEQENTAVHFMKQALREMTAVFRQKLLTVQLL